MGGATYLDRFDVLFVVKSDVGRVQAQEVPNLVGNIRANSVVSPVAQPHLQEALFRAQRQRSSNHFRLFELLA